MTNKNNTKISTKIKIIGALIVTLTFGIISSMIYLNQKNKKDALVINIAGKQRMLSQKISKNIFYFCKNENRKDFTELDDAVEEFIYNLNILSHGDKTKGIYKVPTKQIEQQLIKVESLWKTFNKNIETFKKILVSDFDMDYEKSLLLISNRIYETNLVLLKETDKTVSMYTKYSEKKTEYLQNFQYGAMLLLFLLVLYALKQLKVIERHANEFLENSKKIIESQTENNPIEYIEIEAESEIEEATDTLNCFINKINSAMDYSVQAVEKSQKASEKLEEITDEFDKIIGDIHNSTNIASQLSRSEDIAIQSSEDLLYTTKKLENLKKELDKLLKTCS
ncbi:MAG: type IV pili methyl-accepting chemotaxis transducer N-terminal domain-containing protein [Campylobacterota bacterium]|nr:type IV pili methyl-accepting chemotaxis transducer N-terminal domain-containing protein [Campylobacterota bacterium]